MALGREQASARTAARQAVYDHDVECVQSWPGARTRRAHTHGSGGGPENAGSVADARRCEMSVDHCYGGFANATCRVLRGRSC